MRHLILTIFVMLMCLSKYAHADSFGSGDNAFNIEFVAIGDPGNPGDSSGEPPQIGSVEYAYRIGKHEISAGLAFEGFL